MGIVGIALHTGEERVCVSTHVRDSHVNFSDKKWFSLHQ